MHTPRGHRNLKSEGPLGGVGGSDSPPKKLWDNGIFSLFGRVAAAEPQKFFIYICYLLLNF